MVEGWGCRVDGDGADGAGWLELLELRLGLVLDKPGDAGGDAVAGWSWGSSSIQLQVQL